MGGDWLEGGEGAGVGYGSLLLCLYACIEWCSWRVGTYDEGAGVRVELREGRGRGLDFDGA